MQDSVECFIKPPAGRSCAVDMVNSVQISCDASIARATAFSAAPMHPALALGAAMAAGSLVYIDGAVMAIGLPAIGRGLALEGSELQWVINAYLLPLTALSLLGGAWGDRFGRRRALILGAAIFALSSAPASLAPTASVLIGLRLLQGIGAALLVPNSLAILGQMFSGETQRVRWVCGPRRPRSPAQSAPCSAAG